MTPARRIELDGSAWRTWPDFYDALLSALGAPEWHGKNANALIDSIVWGDVPNELQPPYVIHVSGIRDGPREVREIVAQAVEAIRLGRVAYQRQTGTWPRTNLTADL